MQILSPEYKQKSYLNLCFSNKTGAWCFFTWLYLFEFLFTDDPLIVTLPSVPLSSSPFLSLPPSQMRWERSAIWRQSQHRSAGTTAGCIPARGRSTSSIPPAHEVMMKTEAKHPLLYKSHISLAGTKTQKKLSRGHITKQDWRAANW